jgi:hypothetical protein
VRFLVRPVLSRILFISNSNFDAARLQSTVTFIDNHHSDICLDTFIVGRLSDPSITYVNMADKEQPVTLRTRKFIRNALLGRKQMVM